MKTNKEPFTAKDEINCKAPDYKGHDFVNSISSQYEMAKNTSKDKANERNRENSTLLEQAASFASIVENISVNLRVATKGLQYFKAIQMNLECDFEIVKDKRTDHLSLNP